MTELIVDQITDLTHSTSASAFGYSKTHAWLSFTLYSSVAKIRGSHGISSMTDTGIGSSEFYLKEQISFTTSGSSRLGSGSWSDRSKAPAQSGSFIRSTNRISGFSGSNTTGRMDVGRGYFSLNGV